MGDRFFVDTNVFVYARDSSEPEKQARATAWLERLWRSRTGRLSVQVLEEFYVTVTAKLRPGLDPEEARTEMRTLCAWKPIPVNTALLESAWKIEDRYGFSFWDSLIVISAQRSDCRYLLTEDLQNQQSVESVTIIDPFRNDPAMVATNGD